MISNGRILGYIQSVSTQLGIRTHRFGSFAFSYFSLISLLVILFILDDTC